MTHALVVGGTGMLRGVVLGLAAEGRTVSVVARNTRRLRALADDALAAGGRVEPLSVDYRDAEALRNGIAGATSAFGPVTLAVCWIHAAAPQALVAVAEAITLSHATSCRYFEVLGSASVDPSEPDRDRLRQLGDFPQWAYRAVILGFVVEGRRSRWLTDAEIAAGVLEAIARDAPRSVVGTVHPWSMHP